MESKFTRRTFLIRKRLRLSVGALSPSFTEHLTAFLMCPTILSGCRRMEEENQQLVNQRRKKTRRLKKRKHRRNAEIIFEKEDCKLVCKPLKIRRRARGNTAPQNTTQFIIEDKLEVLPEYVVSPSRSTSPCSSPSSPSVSSSSFGFTPVSEPERCQNFVEEELVEDFGEMYFQKDFEETYNQIREESLMSMSRSELLKQYLQLEMREEELRKKVDQLTECACSSPFNVTVNVTCANCGSCAKVKSEPSFDLGESNVDEHEASAKDLSSEIEQLRQRNNLLKEENTRLKCSVAADMEVRSC